MQVIDRRSSKDEILSAACELTDDQAQRIKQLEGQQCCLFVALGVLVFVVLF